MRATSSSNERRCISASQPPDRESVGSEALGTGDGEAAGRTAQAELPRPLGLPPPPDQETLNLAKVNGDLRKVEGGGTL